MYIYMFMFLLLKHASATSQVTLVTCSGAFTQQTLRNLHFSFVKPLLFEGNVFKTPVPQVAPFTVTLCLLDPGGDPSGYLFAMFSFFFASFHNVTGFFASSSVLRVCFFCFFSRY